MPYNFGVPGQNWEDPLGLGSLAPRRPAPPRVPDPRAADPNAPLTAMDLILSGGSALGSGLSSLGGMALRGTPAAQFMNPVAPTAPPPPAGPPPPPGRVGQPPPSMVDPNAGAPPSFAPEGRPDAATAYLRNQGLPDSLKAGAFQGSPEWGGVSFDGGPSVMTRGQMEGDLGARALVNARHEQAMQGIAQDEELRGDPMQKQIGARTQNLAYERLLPVGSEARIRATGVWPDHPEWEYQDDTSPQLGAWTIGEQADATQAFQRAQARTSPDDMIKMRQESARQQTMARLAELYQGGQRAVANRQMTEAEANQGFRDQLAKAAELGALTEGDFGALASLLYPKNGLPISDTEDR